MKLLHTSDLHLGLHWNGLSRQGDQDRVLDEILGLCERNTVDLLMVAGDVFSDRIEKGNHEEVARRFLERLRGHLQRGMAVFLLRGNHDPLPLFRLMRLLVMELAGQDRWPLVVADLPGIYSIPGQPHQIIALPYVSQSWLRTAALPVDLSPEQRTIGLIGMLSQYVEQQLYPQVRSAQPAIFAAHMLVQGCTLNPEFDFEPDYVAELKLQPSSLPSFTSYNALGHIHLGQEIRGAGKPTWYSGAPERVDLGERNYQPQVLLVTVPNTPGGAATVQPIPIQNCTPFVKETLNGVDEVERFCVEVAASDPLGEVIVGEVPPSSRSAVLTQIQRTAPRVRVRWAIEEQPQPWDSSNRFNPYDVRATVGAYLERAYAKQSEQRARLETAFASLLETQDEVPA
ncbi:MAG: metallophosphoesterase family protein [Dehalococcoidia bacterium]